MARNKRLVIIAIGLITAILATGCWSRKEIEDLAIVSLIGIDKVEISGRPMWRVTMLIDRPGKGGGNGDGLGGGQQSSAGEAFIISSTGLTVREAIRNMFDRSPRRIFVAHSRAIIIGAKLAEEGLNEVVDVLERTQDIRLRNWVLIAKGEALDVLRAQPELEKKLGSEIYNLMTITRSMVSKAPGNDLKDTFNILAKEGLDLTLPVIEVFRPPEQAGGGQTGNQSNPAQVQQAVRVKDTAIFRLDKIAGYLTDRESMGFLFGANKLRGAVIPVKTGRGEPQVLSYEVKHVQSKISPDIVDGRIVMNMKVLVDGELGEQEDGSKINQDTLKNYGEIISENIKKMIVAAVNKAQDSQTDIFGFGEAFHNKFPREWNKGVGPRWREFYPTVEVKVEVKAQIKQTGLASDSIKAH